MSLVVTYHKKLIDGKRPVRERYFVNEAGEKDGLYQRYYLNGQPAQTCTFQEGVKDGVQVLRYENGRIASESTFKRGSQNGSYTSYYQDGKVHQSCYFVNDRVEGESRLFDPKGCLLSVYSYHNGKMEGVCEFYTYDENKMLICTDRQVYEGDKCICAERIENPDPKKVIQIPEQPEETCETFHKSEKMDGIPTEDLFTKATEKETWMLVDEILSARCNGDSAEAIQITRGFHAEKPNIIHRTAMKLNDHQKCRS